MENKIETVATLLTNDIVIQNFINTLGSERKANAFIASINTIYQQNTALAKCTPKSILGAAMMAASLNLPISPSLGMAHIVPYNNVAQFQIGYKGLIQLAKRSGTCKKLTAVAIDEATFISFNEFTECLTLDYTVEKISNIVGYAVYYESEHPTTHVIFSKITYWTKSRCIAMG